MTATSADLTTSRDGAIAIRTAAGVPVAGSVRVASSFWSRFRGLMGVRAIEPDGGLYLPVNSIHMLCMRFPIDAIFVSAQDAAGERRVVDVRPDLPAWRGLVMPVRGAAGVLELPAGTVARTGVLVGDRLRFEAVSPSS